VATKLSVALERYGRAVGDHDELARRIQALPKTTSAGVVADYERRSDEAHKRVIACKEEVERQTAVDEARKLIPPLHSDTFGIRVGREEPVYRPDTGLSFFRDVVNSRQDPMAFERLQRHQQATLDELRETRDVTTADPGAAGFVPPIYLGAQWAELPRAARPFADVVPKMPLPDVGTQVSVPKVQSGTAVAVQAAQANAIQETDIDTQSVTANLVTIAGMNDVSLQALERTFPGLDFLIFQDLMSDHDEQLDTQLLQGTGSSGQHLGIDTVSGINTVTYRLDSDGSRGTSKGVSGDRTDRLVAVPAGGHDRHASAQGRVVRIAALVDLPALPARQLDAGLRRAGGRLRQVVRRTPGRARRQHHHRTRGEHGRGPDFRHPLA